MARSRVSLADQFRNELELEQPVDTNGLFAEEPVPLDTFIHDAKYLKFSKDVRLGPHQYNLIRHMEQIYLPNLYPELVEWFGEYWSPVQFVNRLHVQWGKGAGKDMSVQIGFARIGYLLLCLNNPQEYYGLGEMSEIHMLNVATNSDQAKRAFFRPMGNVIKRAPWFKGKVTNEITDQGRSIRLLKQVELISGHSQAEAFEGLSPIAVVLDEISGFPTEDQKSAKGNAESQQTAEYAYATYQSSASTRFPENYKLAAISYPRYKNDPIQNLCALGERSIEKNGSESTFYVDGPRVTWDVNPRYDKYEKVTIPETDIPVPNIKDIIAQYEENAALAKAKFECRPERSESRFMRNDAAIAEAFPKQDEENGWIEPLKVMYQWGIDKEGAKAEDSEELATVPGWQVNYLFGPQLQPIEGAVYGIHVDLAVSQDRAGIAMCHIRNWERREHIMGDPNVDKPNYAEDDRPIIKVDFVTYYEADMQARTDDGEMRSREIQLRWARNLIRELRRRGFIIGLVTFDTYQSKDSIQILESWGIPADDLSIDRTIKPYANLRELIYDGRLEGYHNDILQVELEGLTLTTKPSGDGRVDHPPMGSKDMSDALCGAAFNALELGGDEGSEPEVVDPSVPFKGEINGSIMGDDFWGNMNLDFSMADLSFPDKF